jgi:ArsR family transcriptional regulator
MVQGESMSSIHSEAAVHVLAALAQESRLKVFRLLVQVGPAGMAASKISEEIGVPASSLSFHLKELAHANLVQARQEGRFVYYSANMERMNELMAFLTFNCCGGNPCASPEQAGCAVGQ